MLEKDIERHLVNRVKELGGIAYKFNSLSARGVSDRIVCLPSGATWFVELKQPKGKLSALLELFANDMRRLNQNYACLWSKEMVDEWLKDK